MTWVQNDLVQTSMTWVGTDMTWADCCVSRLMGHTGWSEN